MQIEKKYGKNSVICEFVPEYRSEVGDKTSRIHIDILFCKDNIPIELKYRTKKAELCEIGEYKITLTDQGAHDEGSYGFWRDVCRIGEYIKNKETPKGYVLFLTNDDWYKKPDYTRCKVNNYEDYNLNNINKSKRKGKVSNKDRTLEKVPRIKGDWIEWDKKAGFWCYKAEVSNDNVEIDN